jgi:hypothetical protein
MTLVPEITETPPEMGNPAKRPPFGANWRVVGGAIPRFVTPITFVPEIAVT